MIQQSVQRVIQARKVTWPDAYLQIAHQACDEYGLRVVLLTYNKALVADIQRLLALRGIRNSVGESGMAIKTIHSFMHEWLCASDVIDKTCPDFLEKYETYKLEVLELIREGVISDADIVAAKTKHSRDLAWDLILIDESQDWPKSERDLIYSRRSQGPSATHEIECCHENLHAFNH